MAGLKRRNDKSVIENLGEDIKGMIRSGDQDPQRPWGTLDKPKMERDIRTEAMRTGRPEDLDAAPPMAKRAAAKPAAKAPAAAPPPKMAAKPKPKPDQFAEIRADLMANAKADAAAKAMAERKRKDAEAFSAKLKGATKRGSNRTGYDAYKSLMGE